VSDLQIQPICPIRKRGVTGRWQKTKLCACNAPENADVPLDVLLVSSNDQRWGFDAGEFPFRDAPTRFRPHRTELPKDNRPVLSTIGRNSRVLTEGHPRKEREQGGHTHGRIMSQHCMRLATNRSRRANGHGRCVLHRTRMPVPPLNIQGTFA